MHLVLRLVLVFAALVVVPICAGAQTQSEYKQADSSYYLRGELFATDPAAQIIGPEAAMNIGSSYLIATRGQAPQFIYLQQTHDWIEPITPPSEPASLNIEPTAMQVREPQGSVQVALPSAPADFHEVERGMTLPNGSVLRTGDSGSVAVLFGGVDSVRLAPNTQAAVQMNLAAGMRDVEIDIRNGMVFSKVGQRPGEKQAYAVHTPFGIASAHGTDYVTVVYPQRVDVWVAQGVVALDSAGAPVQTTISNGQEPLKVMHFPVPKTAAAAMAESAESLTALLNFIPLANQKLQALAERTRSGAHLTPTEENYVSRIRKVVALIKLANVNAPIATPTPPPKPMVVHAAPVAKPPPRALPVEPQPTAPEVNPLANVVMAAKPSPAILKALAQIDKDSQKGAANAGATGTAVVAPKAKVYQSKPVVIVLPPAHFPKTAPDAGKATALTDKPAKTKKVAKSSMPAAKKEAPAVATDTDKAKSEQYLRAQPVNPDDLVEAPAVQSAPPLAPPPAAPPEKQHASADTDPNSLGPPLMRGAYPLLAPRAPETDATETINPASSGASPSTGY
jgi:hypothetical protein